MKLLVVGDFHGKFPKKLLKVIKKEKIDALISNGDYSPFYYRDIWFKHCYGKDLELWQVLGKKIVKEYLLKDLAAGERVFKTLNKLSIPVITVLGNLDRGKYDDAIDRKPEKWPWYVQDFFTPLLKKYPKVKCIDYSFTHLGNFVIIGGGPSSFPGKVNSKMYKKLRRILDKLFRKFRKENKDGRVIFLSHNVPYNTKLDKITSKKAHAKAKGKHYGSKLVRRIIDKYQPVLAIGGHIHEGSGMQKLRKTFVVNPGAVHEGHYAIVKINENNPKKIKVKFR